MKPITIDLDIELAFQVTRTHKMCISMLTNRNSSIHSQSNKICLRALMDALKPLIFSLMVHSMQLQNGKIMLMMKANITCSCEAMRAAHEPHNFTQNRLETVNMSTMHNEKSSAPSTFSRIIITKQKNLRKNAIFNRHVCVPCQSISQKYW